ncbi:(deoxy)nucleoside triphosphate pyrophosphohydrolase [Cecembia calidifontis]|uniref:8-oxo-dGTP diphosphatase n=1 Tax=Cecembia calidifontis TaxID=1187080 RepID=A0A4Q7PB41_9BACT|nr:(deoxy)nucleoside triphosphate pyrophosphohydrolase [Cecembia calidifontis]RZS96770.1 8-oxo-dGTP diphosphatase [Cecembia calidifontis]
MPSSIQVTCALILQDQKVLCAQRSGNMALPWKWEFPGGKIEKGETPEQCLLREIKEELNLDIEIVMAFPVNKHDYGNGKVVELIPFLAKLRGGDLILKEHTQILWKGVEELRSLDWAEADIPIVEGFVTWFLDRFQA